MNTSTIYIQRHFALQYGLDILPVPKHDLELQQTKGVVLATMTAVQETKLEFYNVPYDNCIKDLVNKLYSPLNCHSL